MGENQVWKHFEDVRNAEERRIRRIANPAERARQYAWFDQWSKEEAETVRMLIRNQESTTADLYEESRYV